MLGTSGEIRDKSGWLAIASSGRARLLFAYATLIVGFMIFGGLSPAWALAGFIAGISVLLRHGPAAGDGSPTRAVARTPDAVGQGHGEAADLWRQMLDAIPDAAFVLDHEQRVLGANGSAKNMYPGIEGRMLWQVSRDPELLGAVERARRSGTSQSVDMQAVSAADRHHSGLVTPLAIARSSRSEPAAIVVLRDRTEIENLAQMRADFVANASHELRTPLASLKGFIETMQGAAKDDPKAREQFLGIMQEQAARMSRLIDDLLSLSRVEMREHLAPTTPVDLSALLVETVEMLRPLAASAGITLRFEPPQQPLFATGDRDELMQVAQNLIQNAIKYGRAGGKVDVTLRQQGTTSSIAVADDGIGIAPQHLPRLTERFYRVSANDSRKRGGTGLGLALVKHIVNRHRGDLRIESVPGQGSTFSVTLPPCNLE